MKKIDRYYLDLRSLPMSEGPGMLFSDHEAIISALTASEKSLIKVNRQLAEETAEIRKELVEILTLAHCALSNVWPDGWRDVIDSAIAEKCGNRLVEFGQWESREDKERGKTYRPIKPQDLVE